MDIMKLKNTHEFLKSLVISLQVRRNGLINDKAPKTSIEYAKGQLYEANYILETFERILYTDSDYVTTK
jgi:hypothetical protein